MEKDDEDGDSCDLQEEALSLLSAVPKGSVVRSWLGWRVRHCELRRKPTLFFGADTSRSTAPHRLVLLACWPEADFS